MKRTPLFETHVESGARLVDFAGWEMPVQYRTGINDEHLAVRQNAGIFDVSHMGELIIGGRGAVEFLRHAALNDAARLKPGRAQYSMLPNDSGGLVDDVYIYRLAEDEFMLVCNAGSRDDVVSHLRSLAQGYDCDVTDESEQWALLALQGPGSAVMLERLAGADLAATRKNAVFELDVAGERLRVARTGYTGEDGFELFVRPSGAVPVWQAAVAAGAVPCGLGARDTLRLEAGFPLFGADLNDRTNPLCTPFSWVVKDKPFHGRAAIWEKPCRSRLVGLRLLQRAVARNGYRVLAGGQRVGTISSGTISPVTREGIAMAWLDDEHSGTGSEVEVEIRGQPFPAVVVDLPFKEG